MSNQNQMTMAQLYAFTRDYLEGATKTGSALGNTGTEFSRGYQKALMSLKSVLDSMEKSAGVTK